MHTEFTQDYTVINVTRIITLTEGTDTTMNHIVEKGWNQMSKKTYELKDLIIDACEELDEAIRLNKIEIDEDEIYDTDDMIHEIADSGVPIYYYDIGQYAAHNSWLMTEIPDINPNGNAHDQIQANIYEAVCEGLHEHIAEKESKND